MAFCNSGQSPIGYEITRRPQGHNVPKEVAPPAERKSPEKGQL